LVHSNMSCAQVEISKNGLGSIFLPRQAAGSRFELIGACMTIQNTLE
jgi:hypothetical protein